MDLDGSRSVSDSMEGHESWPPVFLVCHGSFNPVHRHHVEIMAKARVLLEGVGYRVIAGVFAPTHHTHLAWKRVTIIADEHRFSTLQLACAEPGDGPSGWLRCDVRGVDYRSDHHMIQELLQPEMREEFPGIVGVPVKGADAARGCNSEWYNIQHPCVVVSRAGATSNFMEELAAVEGVPSASGVFIIHEELHGDISSTRVREALSKSDDATVRALCFTSVAEYLCAHRDALFVSTRVKRVPTERDEDVERRWWKRKSHRADSDGLTPQKRPLLAPPTTTTTTTTTAPPAPPLRVFFIRHAEAEHNVDRVDASSERDPPLTPQGKAQAEELRGHEHLAVLRRPLLVVSSPLRRALQTTTAPP